MEKLKIWTNEYNISFSDDYYLNQNILDFISFLPNIKINIINDNIYYHFLGLYFLYNNNKNYYLAKKYLLKSINNLNIKDLNIINYNTTTIIQSFFSNFDSFKNSKKN